MPMPRKTGPRRTRFSQDSEADKLTPSPDPSNAKRRTSALVFASTRGREAEIEMAGGVSRGPMACACLPTTRPTERDARDGLRRPAGTGGP